MTIVPSSAFSQVGQVLNQVRSLLNDPIGNVYSDPFLIPYFNTAYDDLWMALENSGQESMISDEYFFIVPALTGVDASAQVIVTDVDVIIAQGGSGTAFVNPSLARPPNVLPPDLMSPAFLWERSPVNSTENFQEMTDRTGKGGLPSITQNQFLQFWEWREDGLCFLGALTDVQVRMRYNRMLLPASDGTSQVAVRNGINFLQYKTAGLASASRGGTASAGWLAQAEEALFQLKLNAARRDQVNPKRRRPYGRGYISQYYR